MLRELNNLEIDSVYCPLVSEDIEIIDCIVTADVVRQILKDTVMPNKFKCKENWKDICRNCKYHNY